MLKLSIQNKYYKTEWGAIAPHFHIFFIKVGGIYEKSCFDCWT